VRKSRFSYELSFKIAFILRTPAEEDCSFVILKVPSSDVFWTWGPAQISFEKFPIE